MSKFTGFEEPQANYSKLPHALIDELNNINSVSELKVILYILRHTWGFRDSDKKITIDEFSNGRKRADGSRMDGGCGIHPNSVRAGLDAAIEHGYILMEEDASDLARNKRRYSINSRGAKVEPPRGAKVEPLRSKVEPRTEKETTRKTQEKETIEIEDEDGGKVTIGDVHKLWQSNMPGTLTQIIVDDIDDLIETYGADEVALAITSSVRNNGRSIRYVQKVLENRAAGKDKQPVKEPKKTGTITVYNQYTGQNEKVEL